MLNIKMNQYPTVSVAMITYNHADYIQAAIEGVMMQQTSFPVELIIGEDCSTDETRKICIEYQKKYPDKIRLLLPDKNIGVVLNCLNTFQACVGKYTAICEGDDYWTEPHKLQIQVDFLEAHPEYAGTAHQSLVIGESTENRLFRNNVSNEIGLNQLLGIRLYHTASVVFRTNILELFYQAPTVLSADRLLNFLIAISGKIRYSDDCMCVYRIHAGGISSNATLEQMKLDLNCVSFLKKIYPPFPRIHYLSYVYFTIAFSGDASKYQKFYYRFLSFLFSFSYFPENISIILRSLASRNRRISQGNK